MVWEYLPDKLVSMLDKLYETLSNEVQLDVVWQWSAFLGSSSDSTSGICTWTIRVRIMAIMITVTSSIYGLAFIEKKGGYYNLRALTPSWLLWFTSKGTVIWVIGAPVRITTRVSTTENYTISLWFGYDMCWTYGPWLLCLKGVVFDLLLMRAVDAVILGRTAFPPPWDLVAITPSSESLSSVQWESESWFESESPESPPGPFDLFLKALRTRLLRRVTAQSESESPPGPWLLDLKDLDVSLLRVRKALALGRTASVPSLPGPLLVLLRVARERSSTDLSPPVETSWMGTVGTELTLMKRQNPRRDKQNKVRSNCIFA